MNRSAALSGSLLLIPLIGASNSAVNALALSLGMLIVLAIYATLMGLLRDVTYKPLRFPLSIVLSATVVSGTELLLQAWALELHESLGIYWALISVQCVWWEMNGFFETSRRQQTLKLLLYFCILFIALGTLREMLGSGALLIPQWLTGSSAWQITLFSPEKSVRLATLVPGAFILTGLLLAARQACSHYSKVR